MNMRLLVVDTTPYLWAARSILINKVFLLDGDNKDEGNVQKGLAIFKIWTWTNMRRQAKQAFKFIPVHLLYVDSEQAQTHHIYKMYYLHKNEIGDGCFNKMQLSTQSCLDSFWTINEKGCTSSFTIYFYCVALCDRRYWHNRTQREMRLGNLTHFTFWKQKTSNKIELDSRISIAWSLNLALFFFF